MKYLVGFHTMRKIEGRRLAVAIQFDTSSASSIHFLINVFYVINWEQLKNIEESSPAEMKLYLVVWEQMEQAVHKFPFSHVVVINCLNTSTKNVSLRVHSLSALLLFFFRTKEMCGSFSLTAVQSRTLQ